mmetsp:Transcript_6781/g.19626  ORF Transcript_6781/g.19626 Transcript_6781/m.19626 type:complete len:570 (+) Transcript_6781:150-1859(+)
MYARHLNAGGPGLERLLEVRLRQRAVVHVRHERIRELALVHERPHVHDGLGALGRNLRRELPRPVRPEHGVVLRVLRHALRERDQGVEVVHLHVRAGGAAAGGAAALAGGHAGHDPEAAVHRRHGLARDGEDDVHLHLLAGGAGVAEVPLHAVHDGADHAGLRAEHDANALLALAVGHALRRLLRLAADEAQDVRRGAHNAAPVHLRRHGELEHLTGHLEVRRNVGIWVLPGHAIHDVAAEHVVHDAVALREHLEALEQRVERLPTVRRVQLRDLGVVQLGVALEHATQVLAHVRVRAVPDGELRHLRRRRQDRLHDVARRARDRRHDAVRRRLAAQRRVDVHDVEAGAGVARRLGEPCAVGLRLGGLGERAADLVLAQPVNRDVAPALRVQRRAHRLGHEVHAEHGHSRGAGLGLAHGGVAHGERVRDEHVRPVQPRERALQLRVHVEVRDDAEIRSLDRLTELLYHRGIRLQKASLSLREAAPRSHILRADAQHRKGLRGEAAARRRGGGAPGGEGHRAHVCCSYRKVSAGPRRARRWRSATAGLRLGQGSGKGFGASFRVGVLGAA